MRKAIVPVLVIAGALAISLGALQAQPGDNPVLKAQLERVAVIDKVKPSVVAVFGPGAQGGGSGVLISDDGYALTNFHVVASTPKVMQAGLPDGVLYDAVLVGLDKVGDVALIKLLPKKEGQKFPYSPMGDSDKLRAGDWSMAMGNPFLLATDFTPTVTYGLISGVNRYQYPAGTLLEYTDCIQFDTSINPGNSGGPLFNMKGELIGINGRGSFDKRGRVNSGVGYAISINQIKNFLGHLKAGLDTDHASLGATTLTQADTGGLGRAMVNSMLDESDVARRGLQLDDEIVTFDGRRITTVNQFKNVLGLYPRGWRVPLEYRRGEGRAADEGQDDERGRKEMLVRLMGVQKKGADQPPPKQPGPGPGPNPIGKPQQPSPALKYFKAKEGFANYYFNELERDRVLAALKKHGDFTGASPLWTIEGSVKLLKSNTPSPFKLEWTEEKAEEGKGMVPVARFKIENYPAHKLEPLNSNARPEDLLVPKESGGMLAGMYLFQRLMLLGAKGFEIECLHGGHEPCYPPLEDGTAPKHWKDRRVETEVLNTRYSAYLAKWFLDATDAKPRMVEIRLQDNTDPCEIYFSDYRAVNGKQLPHRFQVYHGNTHYGTLTVKSYQMGAGK